MNIRSLKVVWAIPFLAWSSWASAKELRSKIITEYLQATQQPSLILTVADVPKPKATVMPVPTHGLVSPGELKKLTELVQASILIWQKEKVHRTVVPVLGDQNHMLFVDTPNIIRGPHESLPFNGFYLRTRRATPNSDDQGEKDDYMFYISRDGVVRDYVYVYIAERTHPLHHAEGDADIRLNKYLSVSNDAQAILREEISRWMAYELPQP